MLGLYGCSDIVLTSNIFIFMQTILKIPGFSDNVLTQLLAGLGAGFFAVCIGSPIDLVGIDLDFSICYACEEL